MSVAADEGGVSNNPGLHLIMSRHSRKSEITSRSEDETVEFAANFAKSVALGAVIALHGELGAGKTVFARGFARGLGICEPVQSPTFVIMHEYRIPGKPTEKTMLYHLDLYRIENQDAASVFGIEEYLSDRKAIVLLEWAEKIVGLLPVDTIHVRIEHLSADARRIEILNFPHDDVPLA